MFQSTSYNESNENWSNNVIDLNRCNDRNNNNKNNNGNNNYQNCRNQSKSHQQSFSENNRIQKSQLSGSNFIETSTPTPLPSASSSKSTMTTLAKTTTVPTRTNSLMSGTPSQTISKQSTRIMPEVREYLFKILVIGELGTGKTSFIKRFVHQYFSQYYRATVDIEIWKIDCKMIEFFNLLIRSVSILLWKFWIGTMKSFYVYSYGISPVRSDSAIWPESITKKL